MSKATDDFVRRVPKVEQHLHLEGSLSLDDRALAGLQITAVETSFAPTELKREIRAEIEGCSGS